MESARAELIAIQAFVDPAEAAKRGLRLTLPGRFSPGT
jgi:hypothetical protein